MRLTLTTICIFSFGLVAFGQQDDAAVVLQAKVEQMKYPPLARLARIQGDAVLLVESDGALGLVSGHPLLVGPARDEFPSLDIHPDKKTEVRFHFVLLDTYVPPVRKTMVVPRGGDAVDRFFLRVFHISQTRTEVYYDYCPDDPNLPKNKIDASGKAIEIWVYAQPRRLSTESGSVELAVVE